MKDWRKETLETYNRSAEALAEYFQGVGTRTEDIERALALAEVTDGTARVIELGCGDGRDAAEIVPRVGWYQGIDSSEGLIAIARRKVLRGNDHPKNAGFWIFDMLEYEFPSDVDIVFAFASLLHLNRDEITQVSDRVAQALRPGGIFYISLKHKPEYQEELITDEYGPRQFFFYNPDLIRELVGPYFESVHQDQQTLGSAEWFTLALRKT